MYINDHSIEITSGKKNIIGIPVIGTVPLTFLCQAREAKAEMGGRQERRKDGKRRQEREDGEKDYQMRRRRSCGQQLTPDKGKKRKRQMLLVNSVYK